MNPVDILVGFISGLLGSMGFGGGTALILYLTAFQSVEQKQAQGINLIFFLPYAIYSVVSYNKAGMIDKKTVLPVIIFSLAGAIIGFILLKKIETDLLTKFFGAFLILLGVKELLTKTNKKDSTSKSI